MSSARACKARATSSTDPPLVPNSLGLSGLVRAKLVATADKRFERFKRKLFKRVRFSGGDFYRKSFSRSTPSVFTIKERAVGGVEGWRKEIKE